MMGLLPRARIFIDAARSADAESLVDIHADAFARAWSAEDFTALMNGGNAFTLGVRRESIFGRRRMLGFIIVHTAADEAEILTVAVSRASRGKGHGRLLMEEAMRRLYREHVAACFLEVDRGNEPAIGLYRSLGFEDVGVRKGYYRKGVDPEGSALVMRLQLR